MSVLIDGVPHEVVELKSQGKPKTSNCWHVPTNVHNPKVLQSRVNKSRVEAKATKGKNGEFYNIGSNKNLNNLEICKSLIQIAKQKIKIGSNVKLKFVKDRPGHDVRYALDSKKILTKLRWKTKMNFKKGLEKTFLWYLQNENYYKSISKDNIIKRIGKL